MLGDLLEAFANLSNNMQIFVVLFIVTFLAKFFKKEKLANVFAILGYIFCYICAYEIDGINGIGSILCFTAIIMTIIWFFKGNLSRKAIVTFVLLFLVGLGLMGIL